MRWRVTLCYSVRHLQYLSLADQALPGLQCNADLLIYQPAKAKHKIRADQKTGRKHPSLVWLKFTSQNCIMKFLSLVQNEVYQVYSNSQIEVYQVYRNSQIDVD